MRFIKHLLLFIFFPITLYSQKKIDDIKFDIVTFNTEASTIMDILLIKKRMHLSWDDTLKKIIDTSLFVFNAKFGTLKKEGVMSPPDLRLRYYLTPVIKVSPLMNLVITKSKDTTSFARLKAYSIVIHEMVHYLQETWDENYFSLKSMKEEKLYISQPTELEAYAVTAYYFLNLYDQKKLTKIMSSKIVLQKKYEKLINTYYEIVYPWRSPVFN